MMYALLPVSLYKVNYQLAYGRPYSQLDRLVLKAIGTGSDDLGKIVSIFKIHRRVLIEVLVTLVRAGWAGIDAMSGKLALTKAGQAALKTDILPQDSIVENKRLNVVLEKLSGQVCPGSDITFFDRRKLKDIQNQSVILPKSDISNTVTSGMVIPFIHRDRGSWIRTVGPINIARDNADFALIKVDTSRGELYGIPDYWKPLLEMTILDRIERKEAELREHNITLDMAAADSLYREAFNVAEITSWTADAKEIHMEITDSLKLMAQQLGLATKYALVIVASLDSARRLGNNIRDLLDHGVSIDLVVPQGEDKSDFTAFCTDFNEGFAESSTCRLAISGAHFPVPFEAILADAEINVTATVVFSPGGANGANVMITKHGAVVSDLCRVLADFVSLDPEMRIGAIPIRLRNYSGELSRLWSMHSREIGPDSIDIRVLSSRQNVAAIHELLKRTERTAVLIDPICSAAHDSGIFPMLIELLKDRQIVIKAMFQTTGASHDASVLQAFEKLGGQVSQVGDVLPRLVIVDGHLVCATSFSVLSEQIGASVKRDSHLGLLLNTRQAIKQVLPVSY